MTKFRKAMAKNDPVRFARMQKIEVRGNLTREAGHVFSAS